MMEMIHETPVPEISPISRVGHRYIRLAQRPASGTLVVMLNGRFLRDPCLIHFSEMPGVTIVLPFPVPGRSWLGRIVDRIIWWWYGIPYRKPPDLRVWYTPLPTGYTWYYGGGVTGTNRVEVENVMGHDERTVTGP